MHKKNFVFKCDPAKNSTCMKVGCQRECRFTSLQECSADGKYYTYNAYHSRYEIWDGEIRSGKLR